MSEILLKGSEGWSSKINSLMESTKDSKNQMMHLLSRFIEKYGAIRLDVYEYLLENPFKDINSQMTINVLQDFVKSDMSSEWYQLIHEILDKETENPVPYLVELNTAYTNGIEIKEVVSIFQDTSTPYEFRQKVFEKGNSAIKTEREHIYLLQLDHILNGFENLLSRYEKVISEYESKVAQSQVSGMMYEDIKSTENKIMENISQGDIDESLVPELEEDDYSAILDYDMSFDEDKIFENDMNDVVESDEPIVSAEDEEISMLKESIVENDEHSNEVVEEDSLETKYVLKDIEISSGKRLMNMALRIVSLEKSRFLRMEEKKQKDFLLKKILEKKYSHEKIELVKKLFEVVSNEYIYDLIIRDATDDEMANVLLLKEI